MNTVICLFAFIYINFLGAKYIGASKPFEKPSLWNPEEKTTFSGAEMFALLTLACAIISAAPGNLLAGRLLLWLILLLIGIIRAKHIAWGWCATIYALYLLLILLSLRWSPAPGYGFRIFLKYLLPFFVLLFVPAVIKNQEVFSYGVKWGCRTVIVWLVCFGIGAVGLGVLLAPTGGIWWWGPAILDSFSIFLPLGVIATKLFSDKRYLWMIPAMVIVPLIGYVVRTGLVALAVSAAAMAVFHYKLKSVLPLAILVIAAFLSVIFIPQLREKMFFEQYATEECAADWENWDWNMVDTSGREAIWDKLLGRYFYPSRWTGSGAGAEQAYMYGTDEFGDLKIAHCDYVQILCDNGLIGLILYGAALLTLVIHSFFLYNDESKHLYCRYSAFIAGTGMCGMAAAMMTDNVVNYTMCTLVFPFTFYAMALGLAKFPKEPADEMEARDVQCDNPAV